MCIMPQGSTMCCSVVQDTFKKYSDDAFYASTPILQNGDTDNVFGLSICLCMHACLDEGILWPACRGLFQETQ